MRRKLVRRLTQSHAFQSILGTAGAYYLRLVWATSQVITEPRVHGGDDGRCPEDSPRCGRRGWIPPKGDASQPVTAMHLSL